MKHLFRGIITLFVLISMVAVNNLYSQEVEFKRNGNWEFLYEIEGVNFYYKVTACNDEANGFFREHVLLKLENTNDYAIVAEWDVLMYYHGECFNCGEKMTAEHHRNIEIAGNGTAEGRCFSFGDKTLSIFSRFLNYDNPKATLTKFELINKVIRQK